MMRNRIRGVMEEIVCDLCVIGSGPAGQKAAIQAAKMGKSVVVVERSYSQSKKSVLSGPGGNCLYSGTIPSKTLREAILDLTAFRERSFYAQDIPIPHVSISDLNYRLHKVIGDLRDIVQRQFNKNGIKLVDGVARFENEHMLIVVDEDYRLKYQVTADFFIIATGSKPRNPEEIPFDNEVILDSTRILAIDEVPKTMIVLGGGIIGSEYASLFAALGTDVIVVDKKAHMLPILDAEIGIHLQTALTDIGLVFRGGIKSKKIRKEEGKAVVEFEDGTTLKADCLLYCLGRVADVGDLHIENAGLELNKDGVIPVNTLFQTYVHHIYAVGDVIGGPSLASTAMEQGRLAARHAFGEKTRQFSAAFPIGIYTIPEISSCGYTENELRELGYRYEVGRAYYYEIARSHISGSHCGLFKILFHAETLEILGVQIIGPDATELIHVGQLAINFHAHLDYLVDQVFNYPTFAEGYRIAALNGLNKVKKGSVFPTS